MIYALVEGEDLSLSREDIYLAKLEAQRRIEHMKRQLTPRADQGKSGLKKRAKKQVKDFKSDQKRRRR